LKVVITGAGGFIGRHLAAEIAGGALLRDTRHVEMPASRLVLADRTPVPPPASSVQVECVQLDVTDRDAVRSVIADDTELVVHLAGLVSGAAEADYDAGLAVNFDGTRNVLDACRRLPRPPRVVFASSIAVYGVPLPDAIKDDTPMHPTLSYGVQKRMAELLLEDATRRGYVDARMLRLPGIVVRPPAPNGALSAFNSDVIREPLAGRDYLCPVGPDGVVWIMSIACCVQNLIHAACLSPSFLGARRAFTLPCLAVSLAEVVDVLRRLGGDAMARRVDFAHDEALREQFANWPRKLAANRAEAVGFVRDRSLADLITHYARAQGLSLPGMEKA
jgi:nucleoside-diphosphate-sugar epimerase